MQMQMKYFDDESRLTQDDCALKTKEIQNQSINDYYLFNSFSTASCKDAELKEFTANNPNLRYKDGFGYLSGCVVDMDSEVRNNSRLTNFKEKEQLCTRWHQAVPNFGKGGLIPNVESQLKFSEDTSYIKDCDIVTEKTFDTFYPLLGCISDNIQKPENLILPFQRGGAFTRDYVRQDEYLEKCGFVNDGRTWRKQ
jgi:hypothetical protein